MKPAVKSNRHAILIALAVLGGLPFFTGSRGSKQRAGCYRRQKAGGHQNTKNSCHGYDGDRSSLDGSGSWVVVDVNCLINDFFGIIRLWLTL